MPEKQPWKSSRQHRFCVQVEACGLNLIADGGGKLSGKKRKKFIVCIIVYCILHPTAMPRKGIFLATSQD